LWPLATASWLVAAEMSLLWTSNPVHPDESVVATVTSDVGATPTVTLCQASSHDRRARPRATEVLGAVQAPPICANHSEIVQAADGYSVIFTVPAHWPTGAYRFRLCDGCGWHDAVNCPDVWWWQVARSEARLGADARAASPGDELRILGRALAFDRGRCASAVRPPDETGSSVRLIPTATGSPLHVPVRSASCYDIVATLPRTIAPGSFHVEVRNRFSGWVRAPDVLRVVAAVHYPNRSFEVARDFHGDLKAALAAAAAAGGGTVHLERGAHIKLAPTDRLVIPDRTIVRGEGDGETRPACDSEKTTLFSAAFPTPWRCCR